MTIPHKISFWSTVSKCCFVVYMVNSFNRLCEKVIIWHVKIWALIWFNTDTDGGWLLQIRNNALYVSVYSATISVFPASKRIICSCVASGSLHQIWYKVSKKSFGSCSFSLSGGCRCKGFPCGGLSHVRGEKKVGRPFALKNQIWIFSFSTLTIMPPLRGGMMANHPPPTLSLPSVQHSISHDKPQ